MRFKLVESIEIDEGISPKLSNVVLQYVYPREDKSNPKGQGTLVNKVLGEYIKQQNKENIDYAIHAQSRLVLHHINGNHLDNSIENICLIRDYIHNKINNEAVECLIDDMKSVLSVKDSQKNDIIIDFFLKNTNNIPKNELKKLYAFLDKFRNKNDFGKYIEQATMKYMQSIPQNGDKLPIDEITCIKLKDLVGDDFANTIAKKLK